MLTFRSPLNLLLPSLALPALLAAQPVKRPPVVAGADVMQSLREGRGLGAYSSRTLQQLDGPVSRAVQDELADSLVAFVRGITDPGSSGESSSGIVRSIVYAIGIAGSRNQPEGATPYAGAGERLLQLALMIDRSMSAGTVYLMSEVADRSEARRVLRAFAITSKPTAYVAIILLAQMEPEGMDILRSLWEQDAVTEPYAKETLQATAGHAGWVKPPSALPVQSR